MKYNKEKIIKALIEQTVNDYNNGDTTVIDELLNSISIKTLLNALPEEDWNKYRNNSSKSIWSEIRNDFQDDGYIHIDGWVSEDENEGGFTIAKVRISDNEVTYLDERARTDRYAQEMITELIKFIGV